MTCPGGGGGGVTQGLGILSLGPDIFRHVHVYYVTKYRTSNYYTTGSEADYTDIYWVR